MGYAITLLLLTLSLLSPADMFPELAPFRLVLILSIVGMFVSAISLMLEWRQYWPQQTWLIVLLLGAMCLSHVMHSWFGGVIFTLTQFLPSVVLFYLTFISFNRPWHFKVLGVVLAAIAIFFVIRGLQAYGTLDYEDPYLMPYLAKHDPVTGEPIFLPRIRALGYLNDPNDLGQYILFAVPFLFTIWKSGRLLWNILLVLIPSAYLMYGLYFTRSRGALLALGVIIVAAFRKELGALGSVLISTGMAVGLLIIGFTGGRAISLGAGSDRVDLWRDGIGMFRQYPLWGVGFRSYADYAGMTAHNSFVLCFAELGLIGYAIWLALLIYSYFHLQALINAPATTPEELEIRSIARILSCVFYGFMVASIFLSRTYMPILYLLLGLITALVSIRVKSDPEFVPLRTGLNVPVMSAITAVASIALVYILIKVR